MQCPRCPSEGTGHHAGGMGATSASVNPHSHCNPCIYWASARGCFKENCSFCHVHHPLLVDHGRPRRAKREAIKLQIFEHFQVQDEDERQRLLQEEAAQHPFAWNFVKGLLDNPAFNVRKVGQDLVFSL
ncbi:unnamed protein product [Durusdinium trenchii]|uniref:C3H1-type domain-containing protein n=1 Tax=Durusdinium trenchii TaxID=1381693 RepID=A0ABP0RCI2_9DINO